MSIKQSLIAIVASVGLLQGVLAKVEIPDGGWKVDYLEDGTQVWTSMDNSALEPIKVEPELLTRSAKFQKRRTDCWGNGLDRAGTDTVLNTLRGWAGNGHDLTSGNGPQSVGWVSNGVYGYCCITRAHRTGNLDVNDVNYAIRQMDAKCAAYTASWFGWDDSSELVGKAAVGQQTCTGPFN